MRMWPSHLNDTEIPETNRFIPKGFELGTTLSWHFVGVLAAFREICIPPDILAPCLSYILNALGPNSPVPDR